MKVIWFILLGGLALLPRDAVAHKVIVFAWVENGTIHTESSFGSKRKAKNCTITVTDDTGSVIAQGQTDSLGEFSFPVPVAPKSGLTVLLDAGSGHQATWYIPKEELDQTPVGDSQQTIAEKREAVEKGPSVYKIFAGIGIIALIAVAARLAAGKTKHT